MKGLYLLLSDRKFRRYHSKNCRGLSRSSMNLHSR